jgi:hypothetical protein
MQICRDRLPSAFADANKIDKFPGQLKRLANLVDSGGVSPGLALCTFCGYKDTRVSMLQQKFFDDSWRVLGPRPVLAGAPTPF